MGSAGVEEVGSLRHPSAPARPQPPQPEPSGSEPTFHRLQVRCVDQERPATRRPCCSAPERPPRCPWKPPRATPSRIAASATAFARLLVLRRSTLNEPALKDQPRRHPASPPRGKQPRPEPPETTGARTSARGCSPVIKKTPSCIPRAEGRHPPVCDTPSAPSSTNEPRSPSTTAAGHSGPAPPSPRPLARNDDLWIRWDS